MTEGFVQPEEKLSWHFPRTFWIANVAELFERAAFYGVFITLSLYLTRSVGFTDVEAGYVAACFSSVLYLLPTFMGVMADKIGFRRALILAFALLTAGYILLGAFQTKPATLVALATIMFGGAIVKPVISGTVAQCSDARHRARAFSIFYWVVNIGAFGGKTVAAPLRVELGLKYINFYAALMAFCALLWVVLFFRNVETKGASKTKPVQREVAVRPMRTPGSEKLYRSAKYFLDIALAAIGLIVSAPLIALIGILIKLDSKGPVFYACDRVGKDGLAFRMYKLRTMHTSAEKNSTCLPVSGFTAFSRHWFLGADHHIRPTTSPGSMPSTTPTRQFRTASSVSAGRGRESVWRISTPVKMAFWSRAY